MTILLWVLEFPMVAGVGETEIGALTDQDFLQTPTLGTDKILSTCPF